MVDLKAREQAVNLIDLLFSAKISTDEFEESFPQTRDKGVEKVRVALWGCWDDPLYQTSDRLDQQLSKCKDLALRCQTFLRTSLEYVEPSSESTADSQSRRLFRLGPRWAATQSDDQHWPFPSREAYYANRGLR